MYWAHFKGGVTASQYNVILTEPSILECYISNQDDYPEKYLISVKIIPLKSPDFSSTNEL